MGWLGGIAVALPIARWLVAALALSPGAAVARLLVCGRYTRRKSVTGQLGRSAGLLNVAAPIAGTISHIAVHEAQSVKGGDVLLDLASVQDGSALGDTHALVARQLDQRRAALQGDDLKEPGDPGCPAGRCPARQGAAAAGAVGAGHRPGRLAAATGRRFVHVRRAEAANHPARALSPATALDEATSHSMCVASGWYDPIKRLKGTRLVIAHRSETLATVGRVVILDRPGAAKLLSSCNRRIARQMALAAALIVFAS